MTNNQRFLLMLVAFPFACVAVQHVADVYRVTSEGCVCQEAK